MIHECIATNNGIFRTSDGSITISESIVSHCEGSMFYSSASCGAYNLLNSLLSDNSNVNEFDKVSKNNVTIKNGFEFGNYFECNVYIDVMDNRCFSLFDKGKYKHILRNAGVLVSLSFLVKAFS